MASCNRHWIHAARRVLLWSLLAFAGVQLGGSVVLEHGWPPLFDRAFKAKFNHLQARRAAEPDRRLVVMLGSSRTLVGLRAGRLTRKEAGRPTLVFNYGLASGGPMTELLVLRRLLDAQIRPDFLFVEIFPLFYNRPRQHTFEEWYLNGARLTLSELGWLSAYHGEPSRLFLQWAKARCLPWTAHRTALWEHFAPNLCTHGPDANTAMDDHGWNHFFVAEVTEAYRRLFTAQAADQYRDFLGDFRLSATAARATNDLLALCRQERIPVALVVMPEASLFRGMYSPTPRDGLNAFITSLSRHWNLPLIDARTWIDDDGFWDGHHLVPSAADAFTDRFGREAAQLLEEPTTNSVAGCRLPVAD